ncbi:hypothetical protein FKV68_17170 [Sinorhizobium mexicanum]|uniref:Uncharacterized protein n=1 Tax=Sinorhizobium mexicanum TaxID=375549 RepID=A0A859QMG4_9HYPH|nr:hypothetical protein FKV68_17170 [Sinorhizobium mexicanum]
MEFELTTNPFQPDTVTSGPLQPRASCQTRNGRCGTLNCCMSLSLNRCRFEETCSGPPDCEAGGRKP